MCMTYCHHYALRTTFREVAERVWWPNRRSDVIQYVQSCLECTSFGPVIKYEPLHPILTHQSMDMLGLDYIGTLPETPTGNKYILNAVDYFTRWEPDENSRIRKLEVWPWTISIAIKCWTLFASRDVQLAEIRI